MMKEQVYPSAAVSPFWNKFVWAYLDVDQPANQSAAQKHGVRGIPAIYVAGPDGNVRDSLVGGRQPSEFAAWLAGFAGK
jgi:thioredoxin-like negative regulator of GroEL